MKGERFKLTHKNEGSWVKWSVVDKNNIVKFVGLCKDAKKWIKYHTKESEVKNEPR